MSRRLAALATLLVGVWSTAARADGPDASSPSGEWTWWFGATAGGAFSASASGPLWGNAGDLANELDLRSHQDSVALRAAVTGGWRPSLEAAPLLALEAVQSFAWFTFHAPSPLVGDDRAAIRMDRFVLPLALRVLLVLVDDGPVVTLGAGPALAISYTRQTGHLDTGDSWTVGVGASLALQVYTAPLFDAVPLALGLELGWDILPLAHVNPLLDDGGVAHFVNLAVGLRFVR